MMSRFWHISYHMKSQSLQLHIIWHFTVIFGLLSKYSLSTVVSPQRFSFFTVYLVQWLRGLAPWWRPRESFFKFKPVDCCKMHFSGIFFFFFWILEFYKSCEEKFTRKTLTTHLFACNQRVRNIGE